MVEEIVSTDARYTAVMIHGERYIWAEVDHLVRIYETLELQDFPTDCQDLTVEIEAKLPVEQYAFREFPDTHPRFACLSDSVTLNDNKVFLNDFRLLPECRFTHNMFFSKDKSAVQSAIVAKIKVVRKSKYYVINVAMVMCLICSLALCAFTISPVHLGDRHAVDFSLVLTAVAFKLVLSDMLPKVSYLTKLDSYVLVCFFFLTCVTVLHSFLPYYYQEFEDWGSDNTLEDLLDADDLAFMITSGVRIAFNIGYVFYFYITAVRGYKHFLAESVAEQLEYDEEDDEIVEKTESALHTTKEELWKVSAQLGKESSKESSNDKKRRMSQGSEAAADGDSIKVRNEPKPDGASTNGKKASHEAAEQALKDSDEVFIRL